ncbi:TadE/TadG family type IV pilus assembly protein [Budvicia aquatica]|uniref:TadE/TadG family type IV pilus assembly protein n=1 Tax=Budvicia aquatica TaxID=82979 RepID=UPI0020865FA7|nr:TadE family protein [Budvicia aquatica]GKX51702.1 hypothetical protein SOASR029_20110 [Budvicia aquatica]
MYILKKITGRYFKEDGAIAIELSLVLIPFLVSIFFIIELCRVMYLSSALDLVLAESGRYISLKDGVSEYSAEFERALDENVKFWPLLYTGNKITVTVKQCKDISEIINFTCITGGASTDKSLAIYSFKYNYEPVFFFFGSSFFTSVFERNIVYVQEQNRI